MQTLDREEVRVELASYRLQPLRDIPWALYSKRWREAVNRNALPVVALTGVGIAIALVDPFQYVPGQTRWSTSFVNAIVDYYGTGCCPLEPFQSRWIPVLRMLVFIFFSTAVATTFFYTWTASGLWFWCLLLFTKQFMIYSSTSMPTTEVLKTSISTAFCSLFLKAVLVCAVLAPIYMSPEAYWATIFLFIPLRHVLCHHLTRLLLNRSVSSAPVIYLDHAMLLLLYQCPASPEASVLWFLFMLIDYFFDQIGSMHPQGQFSCLSYGLVLLARRPGDSIVTRARFLWDTILVFMLYAVSTPSVTAATHRRYSFVQNACALVGVYATYKFAVN
jgi:hypothetical protein